MFKIVFKPSVEKDLRHIPKAQVQSIFKKISLLEGEPFPYFSVKLTGTENLYRIRVGDYRVVYGVDHNLKQILIYTVRHRREVYRGL